MRAVVVVNQQRMEQIGHPTAMLPDHRVRFYFPALHCLTVKRRHLRNDVPAQFGHLLLSIWKLFDGCGKNHAGPCPKITWKVGGRVRWFLRGLRFARTEPETSR